MLDIKMVREQPGVIKTMVRGRGGDADATVDRLLAIDGQRRDIMQQNEQMKAEQNQASKKIGAAKKTGEDVSFLMENMKHLSEQIKAGAEKLNALDGQQRDLLYSLPNIPHASVPVGRDETENQEVRSWGTPREFEFEPKPHWELGADLDILDIERAAKVTGARFTFYKGYGARLERAIINFFLDTHTANGYKEVFAPFMVNRDSMTGTGQLPKFEEDAFKVQDTDYFLIPTAEVPVTNMHRGEILTAEELPLHYTAYSACFRAEAGSAGRDTRGLIRQHQFNKVELVKFSEPEKSYEELESLTQDAERVLQLLGLPYRVVCLCTGDMGFSAAKTYDIEVWMPSYGRYLEISSCSNMEDFQARRSAIRYKRNVKEKARLVHTLNGSGVAVGRTVAAVLENFQESDRSVKIPEVLRHYMHLDRISMPEKIK